MRRISPFKPTRRAYEKDCSPIHELRIMKGDSFGRMGRQNNRNTSHQHGNGKGGRGGRRGGRVGSHGISNSMNGGHHNRHRHKNQGISAGNAGDFVHFIETSGTPTSTSFTVAVQGCSHGELDSIYDAVESYRLQILTTNDDPSKPASIDVLLCCGDVQTLRNPTDFHSLAVPPKYKAMGDFHAYYSGRKVAPILTIMIGGNHESSNYLQELHYGGWVAPNIYYLGAAGVINICKRTPMVVKDTRMNTSQAAAVAENASTTTISTLRIAGISGIYASHHYLLGRFEMPPYHQGELRSIYHTRHVEVQRLKALANCPVSTAINASEKPIDIMLSHDWPRGIAYYGNLPLLLQRKPFFKKEIQSNVLGSPANESLLHTLKPRYWFAAHLHVKFEALVRHGNRNVAQKEGTYVDDGDNRKDSDLWTQFL